MNTLPPARRGAEKTWVKAGLSASGIELTRGAKGGLVAINLPVVRAASASRMRSPENLKARRTEHLGFTADAGHAGYVWGSPQGEPDFNFGDVSNLSLDAKPEKPRPLLGDYKGM